MKKLTILMTATLFTTFTFAQKIRVNEVPAAVKTKFTTMHPTALVKKWEKENGLYEVEFKNKENITSVIFKSDGTYVETEVEIPVATLPAKISAYAKNKLGGKKIVEATKITHATGKITYETEIGDTDYLFDSAGNFISKEVEAKETKDDIMR